MDLRMQVEELRRRLDDRSGGRVQVIEVPESHHRGGEGMEELLEAEQIPIVYRPGMRMADVERAAIEAVLQECGGNRRQAAAALGIGERTLYRKIREFGLS